MKTYKSILLVLVVFFVFSTNAIAQSNKWKSYRSYQNAVSVEATPNNVFAIYKSATNRDGSLEEGGSLLSYSPEYNEVKTISVENGLNDCNIVKIGYNSVAKCLVIIYENGNIDLYYGENDIVNIADLKDSPAVTNKTINNIDFVNDYAYIAGNFGALVLDLTRSEVKIDLKSLNKKVTSFCSWQGYMYASSELGLLKANPKSNMQDIENWKKQSISFGTSGQDKQIKQLIVFNDNLIFATDDNAIWIADKNLSVKKIHDSHKSMKLLNGELVIVKNNNILFYSDLNNFTTIDIKGETIASEKNGEYWLTALENGIIGFSKSKNSSEYTITTENLTLNSPIRNSIFALNYSNNKLLVTGGNRKSDRYSVAGTFMVYENNKWYNLDYKAMTTAIREQTGVNNINCLDLMSAVVDPRNTDHYFVSSFGEGVYELSKTNTDFELIKLHTYGNSSLESSSSSRPYQFIRIDGITFDSKNNLYMTNLEATNTISVLKNDNTWTSYYNPEVSGTTAWTNQLIITKNNVLWGNVYRHNKVGIYVYGNNGTVDNTSDDGYYFASSFTDQANNSFSSSAYNCVTEDLNGNVWVGTNDGPIYFTSATQVRDKFCYRIVGTNSDTQLGYYALDGVKITAIAVDGANRKWFGTTGSGIYMLDQSDGGLSIINYNTMNSSILSDNVTALAINNNNGELFIGTDKGLCSFRGAAMDGKSNYSDITVSPNPVYPLRNSEVTISGLKSNSTVKITDVAGNLIKEGTSIGGQYIWNCTDVNREPVKAGIYLVFAVDSEGSDGAVTKIMVIR
ncbi:hypothetical protein M2138_001275 [Dysgonomonadaceae bacterium PH5-43]|nr:hypothetical protein [Dysgonomonadaceae bacterium PH5-43]